MRKILNFHTSKKRIELKRRRGKARICMSIISQSFSLSLSNSIVRTSFVVVFVLLL